ncbi:hypothetical protein VNO78_22614 [Psophocarpus tetragonolobus]|uniref:Uncharacterized protein n=1 Tax=Psophocarpus tetragonolobus TaxID=3891 RepID=A0AAN9S1X0_PSOTE
MSASLEFNLSRYGRFGGAHRGVSYASKYSLFKGVSVRLIEESLMPQSIAFLGDFGGAYYGVSYTPKEKHSSGTSEPGRRLAATYESSKWIKVLAPWRSGPLSHVAVFTCIVCTPLHVTIQPW